MDLRRALLTALYRAAVEGAAPFPRTRDALARWLSSHADVLDALQRGRSRAHCIALGKAAPAMAAGVARTLGAHGVHDLRGVVVSAHVPSPSELGDLAALPDSLSLVLGDHPVPGPGSLAAGDAVEDAIGEIAPNDVAIVLISGGTTSLVASPVAALSQHIGDAERAQAHIANLAETLLESGLAIHEMNAIRRRVLRWGAGRLAVALAARGAMHIPVFAVSDVIGDDPSTIGSGPCSADPLDDASFLALVDAHRVRTGLERRMAEFLGVVGAASVPAVPAASHPAFERVHYEIVASNGDALRAVAQVAAQAGIEDVVIDDRPLAGDAALLGDALVRRAMESVKRVPREARALYIAGGEPVVHLRDTFERAWAESDEEEGLADAARAEGLIPLQVASDEPMRGGRMQLLALTASLALEEAASRSPRDAWRIAMLAAGTDGRDGPTDAAGAIVDAAVPGLARRGGRVPERDARTGRSYYPLDASAALLKPGATGTNVMDVVAIYIDATPR